jgi:hypothetical protein
MRNPWKIDSGLKFCGRKIYYDTQTALGRLMRLKECDITKLKEIIAWPYTQKIVVDAAARLIRKKGRDNGEKSYK